MKTARKKSGFTLIELLVVIAIIAILAAAIIASTTGAQSQARDSRRASDLDEMRTALEMYYNANNEYPLLGTCTSTPDTGCVAVSTGDANWTTLQTALASYLSVLPVDPVNDTAKGLVYTYGTNDEGSRYVLRAKMENGSSQALKNDYDKDWGYKGTPNCTSGCTDDDCQAGVAANYSVDCNGVAGCSPLESDEATTKIYCIRNP